MEKIKTIKALNNKFSQPKPISKISSAEKILWKKLKKQRFLDTRFQQQVFLGRYRVDFFSYKANTVIEIVDKNPQNFSSEQKEYNKQKETFFKYHKYKVIQFNSMDITQDVDNCLKKLKSFLE